MVWRDCSLRKQMQSVLNQAVDQAYSFVFVLLSLREACCMFSSEKKQQQLILVQVSEQTRTIGII